MIRENAIVADGPIPDLFTLSPAALRTARVGAVVAFALLTAGAAAVRYPIPGSPVPATLQTLAVLACGLMLGPWLGSASMALYLAIGMLGLPVFTSGGGVQTIVGATGGYLIAFVLVQPIIGNLVTRERRSLWRVLAALLAAHAVIFGIGVSWLKIAGGLNWSDALSMGFWPFVPADALLKCVGALLVGVTLVRPIRQVLALR